ncbi:MAG: ribonuclease III [Chitinispirillaceae bacterium]|nr:ribonuclease III [Chitinispirillaceae bacterium]
MKLLRKAHEFILSALGRGRRDAPRDAAVAADADRIQKIIGHRFVRQELLRLSLTHKSAVSPDDGQGLLSNERLEFLGDAVLNCLITEHLYRTYPGQDEGQLSKIKSLVVSRKILGEIARSFGLGAFLVFGVSEEKTGGRDRPSILSNAFEAVLGAVFLDGGYGAAERFLRRFLFGRIDEIVGDERNVNYKSMILEMSQRDGFGMPRYLTVSASGPDHAKEFTVRVEVGGVVLGEGSGPNKKVAQQAAAQDALNRYDEAAVKSRNKGADADELVSD